MKSFAELLSQYIDQTGTTDSQLARAIGVSRQTITRWKEGITGRPNKRVDILAIAKKLKLQPSETDNLLLAAGFRPENYETKSGGEITATATNEEEMHSKDLVLHLGKRKLFLTRRLMILIVIIIIFVVAVAVLDWLQAGIYNPFD